MKVFVVLIGLIAACSGDFFRYHGYKIYNVSAKSESDATLLNLLRNDPNFDFLTNGIPKNHPTAVLVKPEAQEQFVKVLNDNKISFAVSVDDVESVILAERKRKNNAPRPSKGRITFTEYHRYDVIVDYLADLAARYPNRCSLETYGTSLEGRPLQMLRIGTGPSSNPTILIEAGIHAREWIAPALATFIIHELLESDNDRDLISAVNWIVIPVTNPDGYEYSHEVERFWRKTRRPGQSCYGVDGNRNFDNHWGGLGTSTNECSETFIGPSPFSEPEVDHFADVVESIEDLRVYVALHSFGNWFLYPWGWTLDPVDNAETHQSVGDRFAEAVAAVDGTVYTVGNSAALLYFASGNSADWVLDNGAVVSYTLELPGGGSGTSGFDLPPERIIPVCTSAWAGFLTLYEFALEEK